MSSQIAYRILTDIALAFLVIFGLWYLALPVGLAALWIFPRYAEFALAGFAYDALFGLGLGLSAYLGTIVSVVLSAISWSVKAMMR